MTKLLKKLQWRDWCVLAVVGALIIGQVYFDLSIIGYMEQIIIKIQSQVSIDSILSTGLIMLAFAFGSGACNITVGFLAAFTASKLAARLRSDLFSKINDFSMQEMNAFSTASLITRSTNDVTQVQMTVMMVLRIFLTAPCMAIGAIIKIVGKNLTLTWTAIVAVVLMFVIIIILFAFVVPRFKALQKQTDKINLVARENLMGLKVVRAYNAEKVVEGKFETSNADLTKTQRFVNRAMSLMMPGLGLIMNGLALAIVWIGAYLVEKNSLQYADMAVFTQYAMQILMSFVMMSMLFIMLPRAVVSSKRIFEVLNTPVDIRDGNGAKTAEQDVIIELKNVNFRYPNADENVLEDINLVINRGETVAFIGSTGSGKSTLINLIPRFYDASSGEVLIDGVDVKDYTLRQLHGMMGYVPQKAVLFSGTIAENMRYGKEDATTEEIEKALRIAQAGFVFDNPEGLEYHISQGGKNVSGGQKQRLSIARAIIRNPRIFIFDDSFSALDYKTDKMLRKALKDETGDVTTLIVAQRIGTIRNANKIVVLDEGRMVGVGTHANLLRDCKIYKEIAMSQLSKEELE